MLATANLMTLATIVPLSDHQIVGLPAEATEDAIVALYGRFPGLKDVRLVAERGLAFVEYGEHAQAAAAQLALDGFKLTASSALAVSFAV